MYVSNRVRWIMLPFSIPVVFSLFSIISYMIGKMSYNWVMPIKINNGDIIDIIIRISSSILALEGTIKVVRNLAPSNKDTVVTIVYIFFIILASVIISISILNWEDDFYSSLISNIVIIFLSGYKIIETYKIANK